MYLPVKQCIFLFLFRFYLGVAEYYALATQAIFVGSIYC